MSILSFFFTGMFKNTLEAKNEIVPPDFPRLKAGTILHASTADGPLLSGHVAHFTRSGGLTISNPSGRPPFPSCDVGTAVDLEPEDGGGSPFLLRGTVELVNGKVCRLRAVELLPRAGLAPNRPFFADLPVILYDGDDESFSRPECCKLVHADSDGFTFQSEFPHCVEELIHVTLFIEGFFPLTMRGQIVRMEMSTTGVFRFVLRPSQIPGQSAGNSETL